MPIMTTSRKFKNSVQDDALARMQDAASTGDYPAMIKELFGSMLLEAYKQSFKNRYSSLSEDVDDEIAATTAEVYERIARGEKIVNIKDYLWKAIDRRLVNLTRKRKARILSKANPQNLAVKHPERISEVERDEWDSRKEILREKAISIAEGLIPRMGHDNAQNLMRYILGALRNGVEHVSNQEIAEALGLTLANVSQTKKRAFERLARICREEKLIDEKYDIPALEEIVFYVDEEDGDEPQ